tara:strand:+ start:2988 stop:3152 length:165 start_codon:yes stop_codon:yes gene_type:complete
MAWVVRMKADLLDWEDGDDQPEIIEIMEASEAAHGCYSFDILYHQILWSVHRQR